MGMQKAEALARSWKEAFASVNAPFVFGFAAALAWMSTFYSTASADGGIAPVTGSTTSDAYLASLAIIFVVDLAAALAPQTALHAIGLLGAWGPSAAMATGTLMLAGSSLAGLDLPALSLGGILLAGAASALFLLRWALTFGAMPVRAMFPSLILAYILSSGINVIMPLSNAYTVAGVSFVLPFVSLVCLKQGERHLERGWFNRYRIERKGASAQQAGTTRIKDAQAEATRQETAQTEATRKETFPTGMLARLCTAFVVWAFVNRMLRGEYEAVIGYESSVSFAVAHALATIAITVIIASIMCLFLARPKRFRFEHVYRVFFLFSLMGTVMLPMADGQASALLAYACNTAGYQIFCMFMWVIIAASCHNYARSATRFFGITGGSWSLGAIGGTLLGTLPTLGQARPSDAMSSAFVMAAVMALALCYTLAFTERDAGLLADIIPSKHKTPFKDACRSIGERAGLTPRELEVMTLIAQGRNSTYIQEKLFLSRSTVQTHRMHLYQKLGIHTKEELLDLLERERTALRNR